MVEPADAVRKARAFLFGRSKSYRRIFDLANRDAQTVLEDLAFFCRANVSTAHDEPTMSARLDGRREVWLRIQQHLNLDDETLWQLYDGRIHAKKDL